MVRLKLLVLSQRKIDRVDYSSHIRLCCSHSIFYVLLFTLYQLWRSIGKPLLKDRHSRSRYAVYTSVNRTRDMEWRYASFERVYAGLPALLSFPAVNLPRISLISFNNRHRAASTGWNNGLATYSLRRRRTWQNRNYRRRRGLLSIVTRAPAIIDFDFTLLSPTPISDSLRTY